MRAVRFFSGSAMAVNSSSGKRTFSSVVREPNRAPLWYMIPSLRCSRALSSPRACTMLRPSISTSPAIG